MKINKQIRCERFKFYQILEFACFDGGKKCTASSKNSDFSRVLPWYPNKASPNKSNSQGLSMCFFVRSFLESFWNKVN